MLKPLAIAVMGALGISVLLSLVATPTVLRIIQRRASYSEEREVKMTWLLYAIVSALAAAVTAILAKIGVEGVPSTLATAYRTVIVLVLSWAIVFGLGEQHALRTVSRRSLLFLTLSGIATGVSWLAYFRALQLGPASRVAPIDKLSLPLTIGLAMSLLSEPFSWRVVLGVTLMTAGALLTIE
jgi:transporter family protein